ncbi:ABC transporter permease [Microvirga sp. M2]|uniref:ABC transporter permease n=1 Tax=Microvirga sp. M2 TaxID=3073270 RepID=UPI0039C4BA31
MTLAAPLRTDSASNLREWTPKGRRVLGVSRSAIAIYGTFLLVLLLVLSPIVPILLQSLLDRPLYEPDIHFTLDAYARLFSEAGFAEVILNTVLFAVLSTLFALIVAVPMAILVVKTDVPCRALLDFFMQWPFFISALVLSFGWILIYSPAGFASTYAKDLLGFVPWNLYSIPGMAAVESAGLAPIAYVYCANSLRQFDSSLEAAGRSVGASPYQILRRIMVPMLRPPVVYSALLIFSMSIEALSVPLLLGMPNGINLFSSFLYQYGLTSVDPDFSVLGAASVLVLIVLGGLVVAQGLILKRSQRFITVRGKVPRPHVLPLGWLRWIAFAAISAYLLIATVVPLAALIFRSFTQVFTPLMNPFSVLTLENYAVLYTVPAYHEPITTSLVVSGIGAILISGLAIVAAVVARRSRFKLGRLTEYLILSVLAVPGTVLSIGLFWAFSSIPQNWGGDIVTGSILTLIVAFGIRALPVAYSSVASSLMQIHEELDFAARVSGADWVKIFGAVLFGLLRPAFVAAMLLAFVIMMKEYATAVFLVTADTQVIGSALLSLWTQGSTGPVSALAVVQVILSTSVVIIVKALTGKKHHA